jgi:hypothetical protein
VMPSAGSNHTNAQTTSQLAAMNHHKMDAL